MDIVYITTQEQGQSDAILSQVATQLAEQGLRLAGVVQTNSDRPDCRGCDMDVSVLPDGPTIRISQSLGRDARGCKLDPSALEHAVVEVQTRLSKATDLLILNKFGKHEADGRGFRVLIAEALSEGIPVLTAVNHMNEEAFLDFTGGFATKLPPNVQALSEWAAAISANRETAA
tara:strand:+ start:1597 stop:2118 length:522 start_codon:yes stop_codon:yes gene_type:complete